MTNLQFALICMGFVAILADNTFLALPIGIAGAIHFYGHLEEQI